VKKARILEKEVIHEEGFKEAERKFQL